MIGFEEFRTFESVGPLPPKRSNLLSQKFGKIISKIVKLAKSGFDLSFLL